MSEFEKGVKELVPTLVVPQQSDKLLEAQKLLGNMQIHPDIWGKNWEPHAREKAIQLNRIDPAEFFSEISEFASGSNADPKITSQQRTDIFREGWMNGVIINYETYPEKKYYQKPPGQPEEEVLIPDAIRRILRLATGGYYHAYSGQADAYKQPFLGEIERRSDVAENPETYLRSLRSVYSLINKALATQPYISKETSGKSFWGEYNENSSHLTKYGRALTGREKGKMHDLCFEGLSSYIRDLLNIVNLQEGTKEPEWDIHQQKQSRERIFGYSNSSAIPKWLEDEKIRQRIKKIFAKFKEIGNIGADKQSWQLVIALPTWEKINKKEERYEHQLGPTSDEFIDTTLSLIEEQIDYIKRNGERMWQSVQAEEADKLRSYWENKLRPTREKISVLNQQILNLQKDNTVLDEHIVSFSQTLETIKKMTAHTKTDLQGKKAGMFGKTKILDDIQGILQNLTDNINSEVKAKEKIEPGNDTKEKILPMIEPQALLENNDRYIEANKKLEQELEEKEKQKVDLENSGKDKKRELQNIQDKIANLNKIADECLTYAEHISKTNPGKRGINDLLLPNLIAKLERA